MRETWLMLLRYLMLAMIPLCCITCGHNTSNQQASVSPTSQREQMSLNGTWRFRIDPNDVGINEGWYAMDCQDTSWEDSTIPGNWNFMFREYPNPLTDHDYDGTAWYRSTFVPPSNFKNTLVKLHFGAVCYKTTIWINGQKVGDHEGDFLPFEFDVSNSLNYGEENVMALRVETINGASVDTVPPAKGRYDYWIYSGIHREVYLESTHPVSIYDVYVHGEPVSEKMALVTYEIRFLNAENSDAHITADVSLYEAGKKALISQEQVSLVVPSASLATTSLSSSINNPKLWDPESPNLYECRVEMGTLSAAPPEANQSPIVEITPYAHDRELAPHAALNPTPYNGLDGVAVQFGIRKIEVKGAKILVNGKPIYLQGINRHDEYPLMGRTEPDWVYQDDLTLMKKANMNALRTAHYCNDPRIYHLADQLGFFVIEEIPCTSLNWKEMEVDHVKELSKWYARGMVCRDRNHPSITIWSVADEPDPIGKSDFNSMLYKEIRALDHTRLVTYARVHGDSVAPDQDSDIITINPYWGWYVGKISNTQGYLDFTHQAFPDKPIILGEFGADAIKDRRTNQEPAGSPHFSEDYQCFHLNETWKIVEANDYVSGGLIWVFADFLSPTRKYLRSNQTPPLTLNPVPYHNMKGIVTEERIPKNSFLTVMGMFGNQPLYDLNIETLDSSGTPVSDAAINIYLDDHTWCGNQRTDAEGKTVLWMIPPLSYELHAKKGELTAYATIDMTGDESVVIQFSP